MAYLGNFDIYRCDRCGYEIRVLGKRDVNNLGWLHNWWDDKEPVCLCPKCKDD